MLTMTDEEEFDYDAAAAAYKVDYLQLMQSVRNVIEPRNFYPWR